MNIEKLNRQLTTLKHQLEFSQTVIYDLNDMIGFYNNELLNQLLWAKREDKTFNCTYMNQYLDITEHIRNLEYAKRNISQHLYTYEKKLIDQIDKTEKKIKKCESN